MEPLLGSTALYQADIPRNTSSELSRRQFSRLPPPPIRHRARGPVTRRAFQPDVFDFLQGADPVSSVAAPVHRSWSRPNPWFVPRGGRFATPPWCHPVQMIRWPIVRKARARLCVFDVLQGAGPVSSVAAPPHRSWSRSNPSFVPRGGTIRDPSLVPPGTNHSVANSPQGASEPSPLLLVQTRPLSWTKCRV